MTSRSHTMSVGAFWSLVNNSSLMSQPINIALKDTTCKLVFACEYYVLISGFNKSVPHTLQLIIKATNLKPLKSNDSWMFVNY